ncbi:MAG: hypothetical protein WBA41_19675, partial [Rivularia sp. (in: cyanobacteria)]
HLESSTTEYLHTSFLLWEYKRAYSKKEYRELLADYRWDKGSTEEKRALKLAEHFQDFIYRPQALTQIPVTTLLKLCSEKYSPIIEELKQFDNEDITCECVHNLIKDRAAQLKKEKESQLPEKPSIWKRNCRGERYAQFPPVYEDDQQTGVLTQKLMDEYGLIPQNILRIAIADFYHKIADKEGQQEGSAAQDVDDIANNVRENSDDNHYTEPNPPTQTVEDKWVELKQLLKDETQTVGKLSQETGQLVFENCQRWEATVPASKKWDAIAHVVGHYSMSLNHLSDYAYSNHPEWRKSWGTFLANYHNFEQELEWVGTALRNEALIAMGFEVAATVRVTGIELNMQIGKIIELNGKNDKPIFIEFDDSQGYFHWSELEIVTETETFDYHATVDEIQEEEYLEEPEESHIELEPTPLDVAVNVLIQGSWEDIRNIFNQYPGIKAQAWNTLSATQKQRVISITPETTKVLNNAKKEGVIQEFKEIAVGVYQIKMPNALLWEQRAFHEIEIRHYLKKWRESMANTQS